MDVPKHGGILMDPNRQGGESAGGPQSVVG